MKRTLIVNVLPIIMRLVIGKRKASPNSWCYTASAALLVASIKLEDSHHMTRGFGEHWKGSGCHQGGDEDKQKLAEGMLKA